MSKKACRLMLFGLSLAMALALLPTISGGADAQILMLGVSPKELTKGADAIVVGTVVSTDSYWTTDRTGIYSEVLISVGESLKGPLAGSMITIIVPGGTVGQITQCLSDTPRFAEGQRARLFLKQVPAQSLAGEGLETSAFSVPSSQLYMLYQSKLAVTQDTIGDLFLPQLEEQGAWILNKGGDSCGGLQAEDNTITQEESGYVYSGRKWYGDWPVVDYVVNAPDGDSNTAVQNAGCTWSNAGAEFAFNYAGTHSRPGGYQYNGVNEIVWCNLGSGGGLGRAVWWYEGIDQIVEADMEFNTYYTWSTATPTPPGAVDVETVALHEFGHWLSLGHSDTYEAVMYAYYKGTQRTLHDDDIAGIQYIYGAVPTYAISGNILDGEGAPVQSVCVTATGGHEQTVETDEHGAYTLTGVIHGAENIVITPTLAGYAFEPENRAVAGPVTANIANQDFTAESLTYLSSVEYVGTGTMFGSHIGDTLTLTFCNDIFADGSWKRVTFQTATLLWEAWGDPPMRWEVSGNVLTITATSVFSRPRDVVGDKVMSVTGLEDAYGNPVVVPEDGLLVEAPAVLESVVYCGEGTMFGSHIGDTLTLTFCNDIFANGSWKRVTFQTATLLWEAWGDPPMRWDVSGNVLTITATSIFSKPRDVVGDKVMSVTGLEDALGNPLVVPGDGVKVEGPAVLESVVYCGTETLFGSHVGDTLTLTFSSPIFAHGSWKRVTFKTATLLWEAWGDPPMQWGVADNVLTITATGVFSTPRDLIGDSVMTITGLMDACGSPALVPKGGVVVGQCL